MVILGRTLFKTMLGTVMKEFQSTFNPKTLFSLTMRYLINQEENWPAKEQMAI